MPNCVCELRTKGSVLFALLLAWSAPVDAAVSEWIPFDNRSGHITIPITINGVDTRAMLDSGANGSGISRSFMSRHEGSFKAGRKIRVRGVNGIYEIRLVDGVKIDMFGSRFTLNELMPSNIYSADLLIGLPFFNNFVLQIDYPSSRLRIFTHDALDLKPHANVKMKRARGSALPLVKARLNDEYSPWLIFDTGSSGGLFLKRGDADRFGWLEDFETHEGMASGIGRTAATERFYMPTVTIGPFTLENVIATVPAKGEKTTVGRATSADLSTRMQNASADGLIGYEILKHFVVTIDFKRNLLHLEPPPE